MINFFLKAKHWQLFLLMTAVPFIFQITLMSLFLSNIFLGEEMSEDLFFGYISVMPIFSVLILSLVFGWYWSVVIGLNDHIPQELRLNLKRFKLFLAIPLIYIVFISFFVVSVMKRFALGGGVGAPELGFEPDPIVFALIFPLHLFAMFCIFYSMYCVAKTIKTAEVQKHVGLGDCIGELLQVWVLIIGIWFIQPRINRLAERKDDDPFISSIDPY